MNNINEMDLNEMMQIRREKISFFKENNINPFANGYSPDSKANLIIENYDRFSKEELDDHKQIVSIAGRIMTKRGQGKAGFATLKDFSGSMQLYVASANLSDLEFVIWNKIDLGDIVFVEGEVMKTKTGALAVRVNKLVILTKSLRPLPEKFHGLTDKEERYRR
ncbi:MAG: OB-fold nucleic acid binding domain-containing protein, partial [Mycoplasmatales bacterium]